MALTLVAQALDRVRSPLLFAVLSRSSLLQTIVKSRDLRLMTIGLVSIVFALILSVGYTGQLFLWGPLLLGVPHLIADIRYLLCRPYRSVCVRNRDLVVLMLLCACLLWQSPLLGWLAVLAAQLLSPRRNATIAAMLVRTLAITVIAAVCYCAWRHPIPVSYLLLHAHNAIAIVIFAVIFGASGRPSSTRHARWTIPLATTIGASLIASGAVDNVISSTSIAALAPYVLPFDAINGWSQNTCSRIITLFVFMQSIHYAIWLRLIPEMVRTQPGMRGFGASLRSLNRDFGVYLVFAMTVVIVGIIIGGFVNAPAARSWYLQLAIFHGYLELAMLARWLPT